MPETAPLTFSLAEVTQLMDDFNTANIKPDLGKLLAPDHRTAGTGVYIAIAAAKKGHVGTLKFLKALGVNLDETAIGMGVGGSRPISVAAAFGQDKAAEYLKDNGATFGPDEFGTTPATYAKRTEHHRLAAKLEGWARERQPTIGTSAAASR